MSLRDAMPETAAFIDAMRDAFGADEINAQIRKSMAGIPNTFHARENGHEFGTPFNPVPPEKTISLADISLGPTNPTNAKKETRRG